MHRNSAAAPTALGEHPKFHALEDFQDFVNTNYETLVDVVIKAELAGTPRHELILEVCDTPPLMFRFGFSPLKIVVKAKTVGKIFYDHGLTQHRNEYVRKNRTRPDNKMAQ
jgi:hypothetical protein